MKTLRKILAIALLALFGLPLVSPLLALSATDESRLPACCRKNGRHHCAMGGGVHGGSTRTEVSAPLDKCPYAPASSVASSHDVFTPFLTGRMLAPPATFYLAAPVQPLSRQLLSQSRGKPKRGPPSSLHA